MILSLRVLLLNVLVKILTTLTKTATLEAAQVELAALRVLAKAKAGGAAS